MIKVLFVCHGRIESYYYKTTCILDLWDGETMVCTPFAPYEMK